MKHRIPIHLLTISVLLVFSISSHSDVKIPAPIKNLTGTH